MVKQDGCSIYKASKLCGVPKQTIGDRLCGRVPEDCTTMGQPALFNREDEEKIVHHVIKMAKFGYGYTRSQLLYLATDMADFGKKRKSPKPLTDRWLYGFLR